MNILKPLSFACHLSLLLAIFAGAAFADSINTTISTDSGTPLDISELAGLGLAPGSFLFSENTMYDFTGDQVVSIVSADVDPSQTTSLIGVTTQVTTITIGDSGNTSHTQIAAISTNTISQSPEPNPAVLFACAIACLLAFALMRRVSARVPDAIP